MARVPVRGRLVRVRDAAEQRLAEREVGGSACCGSPCCMDGGHRSELNLPSQRPGAPPDGQAIASTESRSDVDWAANSTRRLLASAIRSCRCRRRSGNAARRGLAPMIARRPSILPRGVPRPRPAQAARIAATSEPPDQPSCRPRRLQNGPLSRCEREALAFVNWASPFGSAD